MKILGRIHYNSPVVLTFALFSLTVLICGKLTGDVSTAKLFSVYHSPLTDTLAYPRFFLHVLGHSSYEHYIANILLMLVVGPPLEEKYGSKSLFIAIIITAFISGIIQWAVFPHGILGASGIVFMMIVMSSLAGMRDRSIPLTLILVAILYLGREVLDGVFKDDNTSQITHIIGGMCGAVIGYALSGRKSASQ